jgi:ribosomal 50S subunit-recycling heat shock protein
LKRPLSPSPPEADETARIDVWLWRARLFKTRSLAARFVEDGRVRLTRAGQETRIEKSSRLVKVGDHLVFAAGGRLVAVTVEGLGVRRGPPAEARSLYSSLQNS